MLLINASWSFSAFHRARIKIPNPINKAAEIYPVIRGTSFDTKPPMSEAVTVERTRAKEVARNTVAGLPELVVSENATICVLSPSSATRTSRKVEKIKLNCIIFTSINNYLFSVKAHWTERAFFRNMVNMKNAPAFEELIGIVPGLDRRIVEFHLASLDESYFSFFSLKDIGRHVESLSKLSPEEPVQTLLNESPGGRVECTVLANDHPSVFSLITGLFAATGFNIQSGSIFTYAKQKTPAEPRSGYRRGKPAVSPFWKRRKIIDFFTGTLEAAKSAHEWHTEIDALLPEVFHIVESGGRDALGQAKKRVNEIAADALSNIEISTQAILYPVNVDISEQEESATRLTVTSEDTPFFLYTLSTALALHNVNIESVKIRTIGTKVIDDFELLDLRGRPLRDKRLLDQITFSILFTKQFTYFLWKAPDPYQALLRFENILQDLADNAQDMGREKYFSDPKILQDLAKLLGASDFLWEDFIRTQYETILPMLTPKIKRKYFSHPGEETVKLLKDSIAGCATLEEKKEALNNFKDREIYLIDLDHILKNETDFLFLSRKLTELAELVVNTAVSIVRDELVPRFGTPRTVAGLPVEYAIFGLGKMGGAALGYASDIELLFVYSDNGCTDGPEPKANAEFFEELFKQAVLLIKAKREGIFRIDLRLRPHGKSGPIACSLEEFCRYYGSDGSARGFELLSLIRMRGIGGDPELCGRVERLRNELVYATHQIDLTELKKLREKQLQEKTEYGKLNAKFSPGALVDLEYTVQILQYMYGRDYPSLQTPRIHVALEKLVRAGIMSESESRDIVEAYHFFRRLINGLRMLRGSAKDLFLPAVDSDEYVHLARRMGYEKREGLNPAQILSIDFKTVTATIRRFVEHYLGRDWVPGGPVGNIADLVYSDAPPSELRRAVLKESGFRQIERGYVNLKALSGSGERRRLFARLSVLAWDILSGTPDPDMALNNWERFENSVIDVENHYAELLSQPKRLEILLQIFSSSQYLADILIKYPKFYNWVTDPERINMLRRQEEMLEDLRNAVSEAPDDSAWQDILRKSKKREILRIAARDICLKHPIKDICRELSNLAEAFIQTVLTYVRSGDENYPFCILAFGKLGGKELNYSSDLDLLGIYETPEGEDGEQVETICGRWMERIRALLSDYTPEGYVYRIDLRLRPYGKSGNLVYSAENLAEYYREASSHWEIQALLKLRPVAGEIELGNRFLASVRPLLEREHLREEVIDTIQRLRKEAVRKSSSSMLGGQDIKSGEGGIRDIEFLLQGFQLVFCRRFPEIYTQNTIEGLTLLGEAKLLPLDVVEKLKKDYSYLRKVEHYLQILEDRQTHSLPKSEKEREALARRIDPGSQNPEDFFKRLEKIREDTHHLFETYLLGLREEDA
jgi:[glutamine synthetase] adenylyltransferase / [glutamine synthetase]-adenylyl-L-tyrosine phosphorylase